MRRFLVIFTLLMGICFLWGQVENSVITVTSDYDVLDVSQDGTSFWVSVSTSYLESSWTVRLYLFRFLFDPEIIEYQGFTTVGTLADYGSSGNLFIAPGIVELSWFALTPLEGAGDLIRLHFEAIDNGLSYLDVTNFVYDAAGSQVSITNIVPDEILITGIEQPQAATPTFYPAPGYYADPQYITISSTTEDVDIYYTTDGEEPDEMAILYNGSFLLSEATVIKAKAYKQGWLPSETATAIYNIGGDPPLATITVESLEKSVGQIFEVAINTTELVTGNNIFSVNFQLAFNPSILRYDGLVTDGTIVHGSFIGDYEPQPGQLNVGTFSSNPLTGVGTLIKVRFEAIGTGTSDLILSDFYYNDIEMIDLINGQVTVYPPIVGTITASHEVIIHEEIVEVTISTTELFSYWDVISYNFNLSFDDSVLDFLGIVTNGTLSQIGSALHNEYQPGNLYIGWYHNTPLTGEGTLIKLRFSGIAPGLSDLDLLSFYYNDFLITDLIDGSVTVLPKLETVEITASDETADINDIFYVDIDTTEMFPEWGITSYNFRVDFDGLVLSYQGFSIVGTISQNGTAIVNHIELEDRLEIGWFGQTLSGEGTLIKLQFQAIGGGISPIELSDFYYDLYPIAEENLYDGSVTVSFAPLEIFIDVVDDQVYLTWEDISGASRYFVCGTDDPYADDWIEIAERTVSDYDEAVNGRKFRFYHVKASTDYPYFMSDPSNIVGFVSYEIVVGNSMIALPLTDNFSMAGELGDYLGVETVSYWDNDLQSFYSASFLSFLNIWDRNFPIERGSTLMINSDSDKMFYSFGNLPDIGPTYEIVVGNSMIMIPLTHSHLSFAGELGDEIGVETVSYWRNDLQSFYSASYLSFLNIWDRDFPINIGDPIMINSDQVTIFPNSRNSIRNSVDKQEQFFIKENEDNSVRDFPENRKGGMR